MNDNFEELIHDSIDSLTAGSTLPPGLADRARKRVRRRQHQIKAAVAAGTAAAAALAVIAATSVGSAGTTPRIASDGHQHQPALAVLLAKVERAVASKASSTPVLEAKTTFSPGHQYPLPNPFSVLPFYSKTAASQITWVLGNVMKIELLNRSAQVQYATRVAGPAKSPTTTAVDYTSRTWWRAPLHPGVMWGGHGCTLLPIGLPTAQDWSPRSLAKQIKHAVACGQAKVAGRQRVDGVNAIKLTFSGKAFVFFAGVWTIEHQVMWVSPDSYLPVRFRNRSTLVRTAGSGGSPGTGGKTAWSQSDFRWLPATSPTLANLQLSVPAGFHRQPGPLTIACLPKDKCDKK